MNIYQKIAKVRVDLQNLNLKKSGNNTFSHYQYFELGDFLPAINELCLKNDLITAFSIIHDKGTEKAILTLYNASEPTEKLCFVSPTAEVEIGRKKDGTGGAEPIQNLGGKTTYLRRYLLMTAFEMVESDMVEKIKRDLTDEISEEDQTRIRGAKSMESLTKICGELKTKYKISLITPIYDEMKVKLDQKESKA